VLSLRQLGFSLEEVRDCLDRPGFSPPEVIALHVTRLREQIDLQRRLCERLEALADHLRAAGTVSADEFLHTIEVMTMMDRYYTPEQQEALKKRAEAMGPDAIRKSQEDWAELMAQVRAEMDRGTDPASPQVQALAKRWMELVNAFTGGDAGIGQSVKRLWQEQGDTIVAQHGMQSDPRPLHEYIGKAIAAAKGSA
jgi:DNA-binding transcriptional MerR regulator